MPNYGEFPCEVLGTAPKLCLPPSNKDAKSKFHVVVVQVVKHSLLNVQNLLFCIFLLNLFPFDVLVAVGSPSHSSLLPGSINVRKPLGIPIRF